MRLTLCTAVVLFACGCGRKSARTEEPYLPAEIRLPQAAGAEPLSKPEVPVIYLNVNESGTLLLAPGDRWTEPDGKPVETLDTPKQAFDFLVRRRKVYYATASPADENGAPSLTIIIRVDARTPFEKTGAFVQAAMHSGYRQFRWHALRANGTEGQIEVVGPLDGKDHISAEVEVVARVTAEAGNIAKIVLHGRGLPGASTDLGNDPEVLCRRLKEVQERFAKNNRSAELFLDIDGQLLQADVIRLLDAAAGAGIGHVVPVSSDPKKR